MPYIGRTKTANLRTFRGECDGIRKIYELDFIPVSDNQLSVYIDGVYINDQDFVFVQPNKVVLSDAPANGSELIVQALKAGDFQSTRTKTYVASGNQRIFDCGFIPPNENAIIVSKNGNMLQDREYIISGSKVILTETPSTGVEVEIRGIYDIIDPSGNVQASNNLSITRTRTFADGSQTIFPMHQKTVANNNLLVFRGADHSSIVSNHNEYNIVNHYKYVHENAIPENTPIEFRGLAGTVYQNLCRRVIMSKDVEGVPTSINATPTNAGTSGYTTANNLEARGGSGHGMRVNITASAGVVTGVTLNTDLGGGDFAVGYQNSEVLTIIQSGSTNDATVTITAVADRNGQRYIDINNHTWDHQNDVYQKETSYTIAANTGTVMVTVDGIVQPHNAAVYMSADFNEGSGATNQIIDLGSYVGVNDQASKIEIRDIWWLTLDDDTRPNFNGATPGFMGTSRWTWTADGTNNQFDTGSSGSPAAGWVGYDARSLSGNVGNIVMGAAGNDKKYGLVVVDGIIQDKDTWSFSGDGLTLGGNPGSSDQSVKVDLFFFYGGYDNDVNHSGDLNFQDAKQMVMTGNASTGAGDHQFVRLYDEATGQIELHPSGDSCVIVHINGVYQNDDSYFIEGNKLCFFDEFPAQGSIIDCKVLKCAEVAPANRRKAFFRGDGSTTQFTLPFTSTTTPNDFGILVSINSKIIREDEYALNGTTLYFNIAPTDASFIEVQGIFDITTFTGASSDTNLETKKLVITCNGSQQIFDIGELVFEKHAYGTVQDTYNDQKLIVYINGEIQGPTKYMLVGSKVYFTEIPVVGSILEVVRFI